MKTIKIDKLTAGNWSNWKFRIQVILEDLHLCDIVTGVDTLENIREEQQVRAFNRRGKRAFRIIITNIDDFNLNLIKPTTDPKLAWSKLTNHYERVCLAN